MKSDNRYKSLPSTASICEKTKENPMKPKEDLHPIWCIAQHIYFSGQGKYMLKSIWMDSYFVFNITIKRNFYILFYHCIETIFYMLEVWM